MHEGWKRKEPLDAPLTDIELTAIGGHKATRIEVDVRSRGGVKEMIRIFEGHLEMLKADLTSTSGDRLAVSTCHATLIALARQTKALGVKERQTWEHRVAASRENVASLPLRAQGRQP